MTKKEFAQFAMALKTYYPRESLLPNANAMDLWYGQLQDISYEVAEVALNKWVATSKWSPTIADIREMALDVTQGEKKTAADAWENVQKAIRRYGSYREADAMNSFDESTRRAVASIGGFKNICLSEQPGIERAAFLKIYDMEAERQRRRDQLAPATREVIEAATRKMLEKESGHDKTHQSDGNKAGGDIPEDYTDADVQNA